MMRPKGLNPMAREFDGEAAKQEQPSSELQINYIRTKTPRHRSSRPADTTGFEPPPDGPFRFCFSESDEDI